MFKKSKKMFSLSTTKMMLKIILFFTLITLSELWRRQRRFLGMITMFSERSLVPLPRFQKLGGVMGKIF